MNAEACLEKGLVVIVGAIVDALGARPNLQILAGETRWWLSGRRAGVASRRTQVCVLPAATDRVAIFQSSLRCCPEDHLSTRTLLLF